MTLNVSNERAGKTILSGYIADQTTFYGGSKNRDVETKITLSDVFCDKAVPVN